MDPVAEVRSTVALSEEGGVGVVVAVVEIPTKVLTKTLSILVAVVLHRLMEGEMETKTGITSLDPH